MITAVFAATVKSERELIHLSYTIIRVVFRFGLEANRRAQSLTQASGSWAISLPGTPVLEITSLVDHFNRSTVSSEVLLCILNMLLSLTEYSRSLQSIRQYHSTHFNDNQRTSDCSPLFHGLSARASTAQISRTQYRSTISRKASFWSRYHIHR